MKIDLCCKDLSLLVAHEQLQVFHVVAGLMANFWDSETGDQVQTDLAEVNGEHDHSST